MTKERRSLSEMLREGLPAAPAIGERVIGDDVTKGLCLRLRAGAAPTWIYRRRVDGKLIKRTLARFEAMSLDQARAAAEAVAGAAPPGSAKVSLRQFAATFLRDCAPRWKPSTIEGHRHDLNGLILPTLGNLAVDALSRADVTAWRDRLDVAGRSKDRATSVLSSLIRHAEMLWLRPAGANPCAGQRRHRSDFKARYLSAPDYRRLGLALDRAAEADPIEVACIRFLMLTGDRRDPVPATPRGMIFAAFADLYRQRRVRSWKPSTRYTFDCRLRAVLLPFFGTMPIDGIVTADVARCITPTGLRIPVGPTRRWPFCAACFSGRRPGA